MKEVSFRDYKRFIENFCKKGCDKCPMFKFRTEGTCHDFIIEHTDKYEEVIYKWCEEHPIKTYLQDFKEKFPKCEYSNNDIITLMCRGRIYSTRDCITCNHDCKECWNEEMKE